MHKFSLKNVSSLEKVMPSTTLSAAEYNGASCLCGERFSYQIAVIANVEDAGPAVRADIRVCSDLDVKIYDVVSVPVSMPAFANEYDNDFITRESAVIPDLLTSNDGTMAVSSYFYKALWLTVDVDRNAASGEHKITVCFEKDGEMLGESVFRLNVIGAELPKQKLIFTQWFHCDCISSYYGLEPLSEEHWSYMERFAKAAAESGVNMLLTPIFTPPLDTKIGAERPTVQLIDVIYEDGVYGFDFTKLTRWLDMCRRCDIEYIEISHLFSQWGAMCAPKIVVYENGSEIKKFGWHTDSLSEEYKDFLSQLLPKLTEYLSENWDKEKVYFHISDEPNQDYIERYGVIQEFLKPFIDGFHHMDAISDYELYEKGFIETPVPTIRTIDSFIGSGIENLWAYYCCGEGKYNLSNRFIAMPSCRNRIIGAQLYKYDIKGFLQWGYNFYYSQLSTRLVNPYVINDADSGFPAGDAFSVYPGADGPDPSLRLFVFYDALQDMRAMQLLESICGRDAVTELIDSEGEIDFRTYPRSAEYILNLRERINKMIAENI